jgi:hypothetical protein
MKDIYRRKKAPYAMYSLHISVDCRHNGLAGGQQQEMPLAHTSIFPDRPASSPEISRQREMIGDLFAKNLTELFCGVKIGTVVLAVRAAEGAA